MDKYLELLKREMVPAFGCTEPIALAYTAAKAVEVLGCFPDKIRLRCSRNMIKNAKSVTIPNSAGKKGLYYSVILGAVVGKPQYNLEILEQLTAADLQRAEALYKEDFCTIVLEPEVENLYIAIEAYSGADLVTVIVQGSHTNIMKIQRNDEILFVKEEDLVSSYDDVDLSFQGIYDFARKGAIEELKDILRLEISYNRAIAEEGLRNNYGANIGKLFRSEDGTFGNTMLKSQAYAAAGSDARMSGCALPVCINSGSGNQGMTVSLPIIVHAEAGKHSEEELFRSLIFANLLSLYIKKGIGRLSAYCGVVSAAAASAAGIAFMKQEKVDIIRNTLSNSLAAVSGIICDGAKPSCAMKIAVAVGTALLSYRQAQAHNSFQPGDGIVKADIDQTIAAVCAVAKKGMKETDIVILNEMLANEG